MVERPQRLPGQQPAGAVKIAEQFAFFAVDTEQRIRRIQVVLLEPCDVLELGVAVVAGRQGQIFLGLAPVKVVFLQQLFDDVDAHGGAAGGDALGDVRGREVGPDDLFGHGAASGVVRQDRVEMGGDGRGGG